MRRRTMLAELSILVIVAAVLWVAANGQDLRARPQDGSGGQHSLEVIASPEPGVVSPSGDIADLPTPTIGAAQVTERATRITDSTVAGPRGGDPFGPITSPDVGTYCAAGLDADDLTEFFARPIGDFQGADYQRAIRLGDDRVLWTFQDAFVADRLVANFGMIQSGRCFTPLGTGTDPWLLAELTTPLERWHWILGGGLDADGDEVHLYIVEMIETGDSYLSRPLPTVLRRAALDATTLEVVAVLEEQRTGVDLFGWSVTEDSNYTYLYSHCFRQFGYDTALGFDSCAVDVKLARVALGEFGADREYWNGNDWGADHRAAAPVIDAGFIGSGNNPAQIRFDGDCYLLVEKPDDWWGGSVVFGIADHPQGPFTQVATVAQPVLGDWLVYTTYFAAWVPWIDSTGHVIWSIGHNLWNGSETVTHLDSYRPTFHALVG